MSPSPCIDSLPQSDMQPANILSQLFAALDIIPNDHPIDGPGQPIHWYDLKVNHEYWGQVTGFGTDNSIPRLFTVTDISHYPDGGAMIWTEQPSWAWGVGGSCESLIGPRNRFWCVQKVNQTQY